MNRRDLLAGAALTPFAAGELVQKFHEHADKSFTIESVQDVGPYLDKNKRELNARIGAGPRKVEDMRKVASIPNVIVEKWLRELGVNVYDKNHAPQVMKLLRDPDYAYLRTAPGKI